LTHDNNSNCSLFFQSFSQSGKLFQHSRATWILRNQAVDEIDRFFFCACSSKILDHPADLPVFSPIGRLLRFLHYASFIYGVRFCCEAARQLFIKPFQKARRPRLLRIRSCRGLLALFIAATFRKCKIFTGRFSQHNSCSQYAMTP